MDGDNLSSQDLARVRECERKIGYRFRSPRLLLQALTHSSIKTIEKPSNERLEFLGDSVVGLVVTEFLYNFLEDRDEGYLTQIKSAVVSTEALAQESDRLALDHLYSVGKGVTRRQRLPVSLRANVFEAVTGAIYQDSGIERARRFVIRNLFHQIITASDDRHDRNYKSLLQQYAQRELNLTPTYRVVSEKGPDHQKSFEVAAVLGRRRYRTGIGASKKEAEQIAARETLRILVAEEGSGPDEANRESREP